MSEQRKNLKKYIIPAMIGNISYFILTIVDGMFVGNGVGTDALGAVSLAMPFVNTVWALSTLFNIGGVAVASVRLGRDDTEGANQAFMHSLSANAVIFAAITLIGTLFSRNVASLLGANETYIDMVSDYIFWYSVFHKNIFQKIPFRLIIPIIIFLSIQNPGKFPNCDTVSAAGQYPRCQPLPVKFCCLFCHLRISVSRNREPLFYKA